MLYRIHMLLYDFVGGSYDQERNGLLRLVPPGASHAVPQPVFQQCAARVLRVVALHGTFVIHIPDKFNLTNEWK